MFDRADLDLRVPLAHAGEDHVGHGIANPVVLRWTEPGRCVLGHVHGDIATRGVGALGGDVHEQRHASLLGRIPERFVDGVSIGLTRRGSHRDERAGQSKLGATLELGRGLDRVVDVEHADAA